MGRVWKGKMTKPEDRLTAFIKLVSISQDLRDLLLASVSALTTSRCDVDCRICEKELELGRRSGPRGNF